MGKLNLKEKRLFQLLFSLHPVSTKEHSNIDHVVEVARHVVVVHPINQVLPRHSQTCLVDVNHPPTGVLAVCHNGKIYQVVCAVSVLPECVNSVNPTERRLVPRIALKHRPPSHL